MDPAFTERCHHIHEKCRRDGWYEGMLDLHYARPDHSQHHGFASPPASKEHLHATEKALRFLLPPELRAFYAEVANGGIGHCMVPRPAVHVTGIATVWMAESIL